MKTFKGSVKLDFKVVVTDLFVEDMRHAAQQDDASQFLKLVHAEHPVNDEAFIERVIKNGIRVGVQHDLGQRFSSTAGMGGSVSPGKIELVGTVPEHDAAEAVPQVLPKKAAPASAYDAVPTGAPDRNEVLPYDGIDGKGHRGWLSIPGYGTRLTAVYPDAADAIEALVELNNAVYRPEKG